MFSHPPKGLKVLRQGGPEQALPCDTHMATDTLEAVGIEKHAGPRKALRGGYPSPVLGAVAPFMWEIIAKS